MFLAKEWDKSEESALLTHHYQIGDIIERGPLSCLHRAVHRSSSKLYTIKTIDLQARNSIPGLSRDDVDKEIEICAQLKHPYLCELKDVIAGEKAVHMVYEFLDGDDICFEIVKRSSAGFVYSEAVASHYMKQLMQALNYMHTQGIIHRDIRPHNIILASKDNSAPLKLVGFDIAIRLSSWDSLMTAGRVGIPHFMAPEVVCGTEYGTKADMWSTGVLLFVLLCGRLPFLGTREEIYENITEGRYSHQGGSWQYISDPAKDLLVRLLTVDPSKRISAGEALLHEWISGRERCAPRKHLQGTVEQIRRYNTRRRLKSNVLGAVNSSRCIRITSRESISSMISGEFLAGGDTCSADGCTVKGPDQEIPDDISGVQKILYSLDQMVALTEINGCSPDQLSTMQAKFYDDTELKNLLQLYDRIANLSIQPTVVDDDVGRIAKEICSQIDVLLSPSAEASELRTLLISTPLQAVLQAYDVIVHEIYEGTSEEKNETSNDCNAFDASISRMAAYSCLNGGVLPCGTMAEPCAGPSPRLDDDDDDLVMEAISRVRLVQFQKDTEEPMGITLKVTEDGRCLVARIMHGGMIHRQATLHVGDEIREINGVSVVNQSVEALQRMLREARGPVAFKIVPSYRSAPPACEIFVRAQFDYDPAQDDLIPCPQAGIAFKTGDVLQVISKDDHNWWQARFVSSFPALGALHVGASHGSIAGLIPSPELQEWRTACLAMERAKDNTHCMWFNKKKKYYTSKYLQKHSAIFDQLDLVTYEEVVRLSSFRRKTLVLLGAHGVGRRHIKNTLIHKHPHRFAYPIPHTTRQPRKDEIDGKHYYFVTNDCMLNDIQNNEYLEYGTHEECMYGTKLETIRNIHRVGKMAILDVEPQALKVLRTAEYSPFVVFIAAPNLQGLQDPDGSLERLVKESEILRQAFGHLFDFIIVNNDIDETIRQLEVVVEKLNACPQWVPVSWVY